MSPRIQQLVININNTIIHPIIGLLFGLAFVIFLWGIVEFIWKSDNPTAREQGQKHMIWGVVGMFIMLSVIGIIQIFLGTFGISDAPLQNIFLQ